jgi:hypothetical protein
MVPVRRLRLRNGAMRWSLLEEPDRQEEGFLHFMESYFHSSMGEHLRQHGRATQADRELLQTAYDLDPGGGPRTRHLVTTQEVDRGPLLLRFWEGA